MQLIQCGSKLGILLLPLGTNDVIKMANEISMNTLRPRQNGRHFADDTFKRIFMNENVRISISISLKFVPKGLINNITALVQIMAWRRPGDKPLSEAVMVRLLTHICVTRSQWVKRPPMSYVCHNRHESPFTINMSDAKYYPELILGFRLANERRRYFVTTSLIG